MSRNAGFNVVELRAPSTVKPIVAKGRRPNGELRTREYLTPQEVDRLCESAGKRGRNKARDKLLVLMLYRHGLRAGEACTLQWTQVDFRNARLHVNRSKGGLDSVHPLTGAELRALRALQRETKGAFVFMTEQGVPLSVDNVQRIIATAGKTAGFEFAVHPHMLRHACGYKLANDGVDTRAIQFYLGHANIQHTVRYTQLSAKRFEGFFTD